MSRPGYPVLAPSASYTGVTFRNRTSLILGTVIFHFPTIDDISVDVTGMGDFSQITCVNENPISISVHGSTYGITGLPAPVNFGPLGGVHVLAAIGCWVYDGGRYWVWLNGAS